MHICYLTHEYPPYPHGGIGSFVQTLAREMVYKGHRATAIGFYNIHSSLYELDQGVHVYRLPWKRIPLANLFTNYNYLNEKINNINKATPIDLIEGPEGAYAFFPKSNRLEKIIRMHGGHHFFSTELGERVDPKKRFIERCSFAKVDHFCAVSEYVAERTRKLLQLKENVTIIPNPVNTDLFHPMPEVPVEDGCIVFVGTLCEKKGIRQLIQAMSIVASSIPYAHLLVIGRDSTDKRTGQSFKQKLIENTPSEVSHRIRYLGSVNHDKLPETLARAQVCVYPSHMEAMPIAWLEGMAMGKAVVASWLGPGPEIITNGENGLLCDPHCPETIANQLIKALTDGPFRVRLGLNARKTVVDKFSICTLVDRNIDFYNSCLASRNY